MGDRAFRVLAIDPGKTTGYALMNSDGELLEVGQLGLEELPQLRMFSFDDDIEVVIEVVPSPTLSTLNRELAVGFAYLRQLFPRHVEVYPSWWKQTPIAYHHTPSDWHGIDITPHMRDAIRIGVYYLTILRLRACEQTSSASQAS